MACIQDGKTGSKHEQSGKEIKGNPSERRERDKRTTNVGTVELPRAVLPQRTPCLGDGEEEMR